MSLQCCALASSKGALFGLSELHDAVQFPPPDQPLILQTGLSPVLRGFHMDCDDRHDQEMFPTLSHAHASVSRPM
jgi:hypothetical protein